MTRLVSVIAADGERVGALIGNEVLLLAAAEAMLLPSHEQPALAPTIAGLFAAASAPAQVFARLRRIAEAVDAEAAARLREAKLLLPRQTCRFDAPIPRPGLIICSGNTYARHVREMGGQVPAHPMGFQKSPHTVVGPGAPIVLPPAYPSMVDFEGEFALIIGQRCHRVDVADAAGCIAGYTLVNDVSARDWVDETRRTGDMFFNTLGKQFPSFCPMGPALVTADEIGDPSRLALQTRVNGRLMQSAPLNDLLFPVAELLAFWSQWYEFSPGDVITTGSPPGVGFAQSPPVFLAPGDRVAIEVEGIGVLHNAVQAAALA